MITLAMIAALEMPPKRYDHPPRVEPRIFTAPANLIRAHCGGHAEGLLLSCWNEARGTIYIRVDLTPKARAKVLRHEYAHVNGWVHEDRPANAPSMKPSPGPTP